MKFKPQLPLRAKMETSPSFQAAAARRCSSPFREDGDVGWEGRKSYTHLVQALPHRAEAQSRTAAQRVDPHVSVSSLVVSFHNHRLWEAGRPELILPILYMGRWTQRRDAQAQVKEWNQCWGSEFRI